MPPLQELTYIFKNETRKQQFTALLIKADNLNWCL